MLRVDCERSLFGVLWHSSFERTGNIFPSPSPLNRGANAPFPLWHRPRSPGFFHSETDTFIGRRVLIRREWCARKKNVEIPFATSTGMRTARDDSVETERSTFVSRGNEIQIDAQKSERIVWCFRYVQGVGTTCAVDSRARSIFTSEFALWVIAKSLERFVIQCVEEESGGQFAVTVAGID